MDGKGSNGLSVFSENSESWFLTIRYVGFIRQEMGLECVHPPNGLCESSTGNLWIRGNPTV